MKNAGFITKITNFLNYFILFSYMNNIKINIDAIIINVKMIFFLYPSPFW